MKDFLKKFKVSKKLFVTVFTALLVAANEKYNLGLSNDTIITLVALAVGYIFGQAAVDKELVKSGLKFK